jgi:replication factor A1
MLATQMNEIITNGTLNIGAIIALNEYICNIVGGNRKILIILNLQVLNNGPGYMIGDAVNIENVKIKQRHNENDNSNMLTIVQICILIFFSPHQCKLMNHNNNNNNNNNVPLSLKPVHIH